MDRLFLRQFHGASPAPPPLADLAAIALGRAFPRNALIPRALVSVIRLAPPASEAHPHQTALLDAWAALAARCLHAVLTPSANEPHGGMPGEVAGVALAALVRGSGGWAHHDLQRLLEAVARCPNNSRVRGVAQGVARGEIKAEVRSEERFLLRELRAALEEQTSHTQADHHAVADPVRDARDALALVEASAPSAANASPAPGLDAAPPGVSVVVKPTLEVTGKTRRKRGNSLRLVKVNGTDDWMPEGAVEALAAIRTNQKPQKDARSRLMMWLQEHELHRDLDAIAVTGLERRDDGTSMR